LYYTLVGLSLAAALALFIALILLWVDMPEQRDDTFVALQPVIPWVFAVYVTLKYWSTAWALRQSRRNQQLTDHAFTFYLYFWLAVTSCLLILAYLLSPNVIWLRNIMFLVALLTVPSARLAAAPLAVAWNRHR